MKDDDNETGGNESVTVASFTAAQAKAKREGENAGTALERQRVSDINQAFSLHASRTGVLDLANECIEKGTTAERASKLLLEYLAGDPQPIGQSREQGESSHGPAIPGSAVARSTFSYLLN